MNQGKRIVINLHETDTQEFKSENLIQSDAKKSFAILIENFIKNIDNKKDKPSHMNRVHNTILINGKRGMGKTSFILSMKDDDNLMEELCPLEIIDPTLIETKEHVFLNIITSIKDKVEEHLKCQSCNDRSSLQKNWKESLRSLAGGLSMLDDIGSNHLQESMWDSPELILEKGLSNAKQGANLEKNFHKFIDESLSILGKEKKAFFLILDDIDTSLDKGTAILETLRKYLTSPKLIIAMLGDIDLYSTLVRQLQWEKMDPKKILKDYEEGHKKYLPQIEHLEEQYLTKVLKPENRIDLKNLLVLKNKLAINSENNHFEELISDILKITFLINNNDIKDFENTFLSQSTRSVIQVLQAWDKEIGLSSHIIDRFRHTFYTTLKNKLEQYNLVEFPEKEKFLNFLAVYILSENLSKDNHLKLTPNFAQDDNNIAMLYINMLANYLLEPKDYLSYFIKVGYAYEGYEDLETEKDQKIFLDNIVLNSSESISILTDKVLSTLKLQASNTVRSGYKHLGNMFVPSTEINKLDNKLLILISKLPESKQGLNFFSFFKLLGYITDIQYSSEKHNEDISNWIKKSENIEKLPLFILAKIWQRVLNTFSQIDKRYENREKSYADMLQLYIAGFLNAVYVEIGLYYNQDIKLDNVSTSIKSFTDKLDNYSSFDSHYTLFDYLYECPQLDLNKPYFTVLTEIQMENNDNKLKDYREKLPIDFSKLSSEKQEMVVKSIKGWEDYAIPTIANKLRYHKGTKFKNVSPRRISEILEKLKNK